MKGNPPVILDCDVLSTFAKTNRITLLESLPGYYDRALSKQHVDKYRSSVYGTRVQVYRIEPEKLSAKENQIDKEKMFVSGKSATP